MSILLPRCLSKCFNPLLQAINSSACFNWDRLSVRESNQRRMTTIDKICKIVRCYVSMLCNVFSENLKKSLTNQRLCVMIMTDGTDCLSILFFDNLEYKIHKNAFIKLNGGVTMKKEAISANSIAKGKWTGITRSIPRNDGGIRENFTGLAWAYKAVKALVSDKAFVDTAVVEFILDNEIEIPEEHMAQLQPIVDKLEDNA